MTIERVTGVLLSAEDVEYALAAFDVLLVDRRPSPKLQHFIDRLRRTGEKLACAPANTGVGAREVGAQQDSAHYAMYDLLDTDEAARILGITPNGVRDLARRGVLPTHRAGSRHLLPAAAVVARAERRAARRE